MEPIFDFGQYDPPRLTEQALAAAARRRRQRHYAAFPLLASWLWNAAMGAFCWGLYSVRPSAGIAALVFWALSLMATGIASLVFVNRKDIVL